MAAIDHLVFAGPNLAAAVDHVEELTGVRAEPGGQHTGWGTANHLASLGDCYLEIIGPDPAQPDPSEPRSFGIDELDGPRLVTFAIRPTGDETFESVVGVINQSGFSTGPLRAMSRTRPDGVELSWQLSRSIPDKDGNLPMGGLIPFVIDWGSTPNPATSATPGLTLERMRVAGPDTTGILDLYERLGLDIAVDRGELSLTARLAGPKSADLT